MLLCSPANHWPVMGGSMKADKRTVSRETQEQDKQEARKARNEEQAIEEVAIWAQVNSQAEQAVTVAKRKQGALSTYSEAIGKEIVTRLASGQSLHSICKLDHMPHISTIYDWIGKEPSFAEHYGRAREQAAHTLFDQMIDIADDCSNDLLKDGTPNNAAIQRAKLQIDTRARVAGKLAPRVYGERIEQLNQTVNIDSRSVIVDGRALDITQRDALRALLLSAKGD